jgi:hypothetical protein
LREALNDKYEFAKASDGQADFLPAAWKPPETITPEMIEVAAQQLETTRRSLSPAVPEAIAKWLVQLGMGTASRDKGESEMRNQASLYANMLDDLPACAFTKGSLRRALDLFEWFPTVKTLREFARSEESRMKTRDSRLAQIVEAGPRQGSPQVRWSKEAAEAHAVKLREKKAAELAALAKIVAEQDAGAFVPATAANKPSMRGLPTAQVLKAARAAIKRTGDE